MTISKQVIIKSLLIPYSTRMYNGCKTPGEIMDSLTDFFTIDDYCIGTCLTYFKVIQTKLSIMAQIRRLGLKLPISCLYETFSIKAHYSADLSTRFEAALLLLIQHFIHYFYSIALGRVRMHRPLGRVRMHRPQLWSAAPQCHLLCGAVMYAIDDSSLYLCRV